MLHGTIGDQGAIKAYVVAGGNIGAEAAVRAPADGYTLLMAGTPNTINTTLYENSISILSVTSHLSQALCAFHWSSM